MDAEQNRNDNNDNEFAQDLASPLQNTILQNPEEDRPQASGVREFRRREETAADQSANRTLGWVSLIAAFASLFVWPAVLAPTAAVVGMIAYAQGARTLGVWAVIIGLVSLIAYLFLLPLYA